MVGRGGNSEEGEARRKLRSAASLLAWNGLSSVSVAPDGRHVLFNAGDVHGEIWLLENPLGTARAPH